MVGSALRVLLVRDVFYKHLSLIISTNPTITNHFKFYKTDHSSALIIILSLLYRNVATGCVCGGGGGQNVGQNGTNICLKLKVKVMKSFAILTISKLWSCLR
jgi:hypothetical protein